jgi:hypothetical protein
MARRRGRGYHLCQPLPGSWALLKLWESFELWSENEGPQVWRTKWKDAGLHSVHDKHLPGRWFVDNDVLLVGDARRFRLCVA